MWYAVYTRKPMGGIVGMARKPLHKALENARLLKEYASWIYCTGCDKTVAYLCYVTYDQFDFTFTCACGSHGRVAITLADRQPAQSGEALQVIKNRLCCPRDAAPLLSLVDKNLTAYRLRIACSACNTVYAQQKADPHADSER